jgi:ubiquinol-cytochrome c reductase cytochrome c subunit
MLAGPLAVIGLGVMAFSALTVTGTVHGQLVPSTNPIDIAAGQQLYTTHCQSCHGIDGVGGVNGAPELIDAGAAAADFYLSTGRMPLNNPADQPIRHRPYFDPHQIFLLVSYINALPEINGTDVHGPGIPTILPECPASEQTATDHPAGCVTLAEGQINYLLDCSQCHHANAAGGMLSKGYVVPGLRNSTPTQVAEAARVGPLPMPKFGPGQLSDSQLSAIANYVDHLNHSSQHGGLSISRWGPVAEGFVGIMIGLVLILVFVRLIGTRG